MTISWKRNIKDKDSYLIHIAFADAYNGPDGRGGGMNVNTTSAWVRIGFGRWYRCSTASMHKIKERAESFDGPVEELLAHLITGD